MKIFCLFSIDNNYDQPPNNLVCWWSKKPSIPELAKAIGVSFPAPLDEDTLAIAKIWSGKHAGDIDTVQYRLDEVEEGKAP